MKQSAQPCLYISRSKEIKVPVPPLAEQRRIVAKVEELMRLCDELEARQTEQRAVRVRMSQAALNQLTKAKTPAEFAPAWQRLNTHFDNLFARPESLAQLRQNLLQLAVMGKLVEQDPNDEPAAELLSRIGTQKRKLEKSGEFKKQTAASPIKDSEILFPIPKNWQWVRAAEISYPISSGSTPAKTQFQDKPEGGIPYLKVYNIRDQRIDFDYKPQYIKQDHHVHKMKRSTLVPGMVVLNIVGPPLGKTAIVPDSFPEWNCNQAIAFFRLIEGVLPAYLHFYFCAGSFLRNIELIGTAGQDNISVTKCKNIVVPIPPASEQKRIVERVQQLMALCNSLEAQLARREASADELLEAMVAAILDGGGKAAEAQTNERRRTV